MINNANISSLDMKKLGIPKHEQVIPKVWELPNRKGFINSNELFKSVSKKLTANVNILNFIIHPYLYLSVKSSSTVIFERFFGSSREIIYIILFLNF